MSGGEIGVLVLLGTIVILLIDISRSLDIIKRQGGFGKKP